MATAVTLVFAGHETTANIVSNAVLALLELPDQLEALRADPSLTEAAIEEALRYDCSVQRVRRVALDDVELEGRRSPAATAGSTSSARPTATRRSWKRPTASTCRAHDPPSRLRLRPALLRGAALARMEAPIMLGALSTATARSRWRRRWLGDDIVMRGPEQLLLRVS